LWKFHSRPFFYSNQKGYPPYEPNLYDSGHKKSVIVIRAVQEQKLLDEPERITVTITRRQAQKGQVELTLGAAERMMAALERAGWQVQPSLRGGFSWTARPTPNAERRYL